MAHEESRGLINGMKTYKEALADRLEIGAVEKFLDDAEKELARVREALAALRAQQEPNESDYDPVCDCGVAHLPSCVLMDGR